MNALPIATAILASISFVLILTALASDYWVTGRYHRGLWQSCDGRICHVYGLDVKNYIHATRFFVMMSMFAGAVSVVILWALYFKVNIGTFATVQIACIASVVAGLFALIAMSIFTGESNSSSKGGCYDWSFALGWVSSLLFFLTGGLAYQMHTGRLM